ncbi:glycosyltransferase family 2 protein [bacterium]|nr:MAG: glycosyltransferase [candidate division KSB1 bacterium]MCE7943318.1 glycosyltransferase [Chlorobi bacterium CHB1]MCL4704559.1 glycosyltransferase family 2 protein [bacterium]MDL1876066.1 glycosyltransferase family 2 protein [Cytophagia bacterium CHB2]MBC6949047.1 glycosyltransferase [candidate division KSB1 bacterium]
MAKTTEKIYCSIVIPVMNEEENVPLLHRAISAAMQAWGKSYEIVIVDDGSTDRTFELLQQIARNDVHVRVVKFRGNYGQSAAMAAGFDHARGEVVVTMDGDLQNDPKDIPNVVAKLEEGFDIVSGWRKNRKDKLVIRKIPSKIANRLIRKTTRVDLHDTGCSLKAYRSEVVQKIRLYGELHRFIPALARIEGARISEMVVNHHERKFGQSKYNITRTFRVIMDLMTLNLLLKYLTRPLHFFGALTVFFNGLGLAALLALLLEWRQNQFVGSDELNVLMSVAFLLFAAGINFLFYGLIANSVVGTGQKRDERLYEFKYYHGTTN